MNDAKIANRLINIAKSLKEAAPAEMTVGKLRAMLKKFPDNTRIAVASAPNITGWINNIQPRVGKTDDGILVLGLDEETIGEEEADFEWLKR